MTEQEQKYNANPFAKAVKTEAKLRFAIAGPSGSGKTYTALSLAKELGGKVAMLDTEHGSASKYADLFDFDVMNLDPPYHPDRYAQAIKAAAQAGYDILIVDSLSHAWFGPGGLLEIVDHIAAQMKTSNTFAAWKDATPIQQRLVESMLAAPLHLIACLRSKTAYSMEKDERGKTVIEKRGLEPIQRDGMEYEFDVFSEMTVPDNKMIVTKSRCPALSGQVYTKPTGKELADALKAWLSGAKPPHWIDDDRKRAVFWMKMGEFGFDEKTVKRLTGIEHIHEWQGTASDLIAHVRELAAKEQENEPLQEVPA